MSLRCTVLRTSLCLLPALLLFSSLCCGQTPAFDTSAFYRHLKEEGLLAEQVVFSQRLLKAPPTSLQQHDTLLLYLSASFLKLMMIDSSASGLKKVSANPLFSEERKQLYIASLILCREYSLAEKNPVMPASDTFVRDARTALSILKRETLSTDSSPKDLSEVIYELRGRYVQTPRHSPFLAGVFSAMLPGAGKWYVGNKRQAVTSFISNALFAAQAIESYSKAGLESPQFILTAGLFGIFYSGNIWGSVLAAKKKKRDRLNQIDHEILDHYRTEFTRLSR